MLLELWPTFANGAKIVVVQLCVISSFGREHAELQPRITKTLINTFLDPTKTLTSHYGAIRGIAAMGPQAVQLIVVRRALH